MPGAADKGFAFNVLFVARAFTDNHQVSLLIADAGYLLRAVCGELAGLAGMNGVGNGIPTVERQVEYWFADNR